jgi:protein ImuA
MKTITTTRSVEEAVEALRARLRQMAVEHTLRRPEDATLIATGCPALDRLLPEGGWRRGTLVEWLFAGRGGGAGALAMITARQAATEGGAVVVMDNRHDFYPPAAAALGIDLENLIVIRAATPKDRLWALDQALRCEGVAAVWAPQEELDPHTFRRLQLAAEASGALGLLVRHERVRDLPSWSHVQLLVQTLPAAAGTSLQEGRSEERSGAGGDRRLRVELLRSHHGKSGGWAELQIDEVTGAIREARQTDEPHLVHPPAQLAGATRRRRPARA